MVQIYPIDVAKTLYQKALLSAGSGHAERPKIKIFAFGAYRGKSILSASPKDMSNIDIKYHRSWRFGLTIVLHKRDIL